MPFLSAKNFKNIIQDAVRKVNRSRQNRKEKRLRADCRSRRGGAFYFAEAARCTSSKKDIWMRGSSVSSG